MASDSVGRKRARADMENQSVVVMVNGLPGALAEESAKACLRRGLLLREVALTGPRGTPSALIREGGQAVSIQLVGSGDNLAQLKVLKDAVQEHGERLVIIDCTHPSAVNSNVELYVSAGCAFVMGTTGGDREALLKRVSDGGIYAVIAANMCKQIVALQAGFAKMASDFPEAFAGYTIDITESHQKTKADTSGTAKDMVRSFQKLGLDAGEEKIQKFRDEVEQIKFGVPSTALAGHAFHTYTLRSSDGSVEFQIKHNVIGRATYGDGVADAVIFLAGRRTADDCKKIYDMVDVLSAGAMT